MPALITHYLFGEELIPHIDEALEMRLGTDKACHEAFSLGCQGPDPFFFCTTSLRAKQANAMGNQMHKRKVSAAFDLLRSDVKRLPAERRALGECFVAGLFAHYMLDRNAHPYVYAHEFELCDYNRSLADAYREVHAVIESEIDCGMLDVKRHVSVADFAPADVLEARDEVLIAAGTLLAQTAQAVLDIDLRPTDYVGSVQDMRLCYHTIEPYESGRAHVIARTERLAHPHSLMLALSHKQDDRADNPSMNAEHHAWTHPFEGTISHESFEEVFARAVRDYLDHFPAFIRLISAADFVRGLNYTGKLMDRFEEPAGCDHPI